MAPVVRPPVPVASATATQATEQLPVLAKFDSHCLENGQRSLCARKVEIAERLLPAFGILAQGTQIRVPGGTVAVEDLCPGDIVTDAEGASQTLTSIGEVTLRPDALETPWLRRIQPERFGFACPLSDLIVGAGAEILLDRFSGTSRAVSRFEHDDMISSLRPQAPVRLFQLGCASPAWICANGLTLRTLDIAAFLKDQPELLAGLFRKLMPGRAQTGSSQPFVIDSPFRRARLG